MKGSDYAYRPICQETLENGAGANSHLRCHVVAQMGGHDLGLIMEMISRDDWNVIKRTLTLMS